MGRRGNGVEGRGKGENDQVLFEEPWVTCGLGLAGRSSLLALQTFLDEIDVSTWNSVWLSNEAPRKCGSVESRSASG